MGIDAVHFVSAASTQLAPAGGVLAEAIVHDRGGVDPQPPRRLAPARVDTAGHRPSRLGGLGIDEQLGEIDLVFAGRAGGLADEEVDPAHQIFWPGEPHHGQLLPEIAGQGLQIANHALPRVEVALLLLVGQILVLAAALLEGHQAPGHQIALGGDAGGAHAVGAAVAEDALLGEHQGGAQGDLVGADGQHRGHVEAGLDPPVGPQPHPPADPVDHQGLVGLGEGALQRQAGVLDR